MYHPINDPFLQDEPKESITPEEGCLGCIVSIALFVVMLIVCVIIHYVKFIRL